MTVRVRVLVSGRVQGVFFRASTAEQARSEGVGGRVRNLPDGRVEAVFEGARDAVERLVSWCRSGPDYAAVDAVERFDETPEGENDFRIV